MLHPGERGVEGVLVSMKDATWLWRRCLRALPRMMQVLERVLEGPGEGLKLGFQEHIHILCLLEHW